MGREVSFDYSKAAEFISAEELENIKGAVLSAKDVLVNKTGAGNDFLGWIDLPVDYDKEEFDRIKINRLSKRYRKPYRIGMRLPRIAGSNRKDVYKRQLIFFTFQFLTVRQGINQLAVFHHPINVIHFKYLI